jgi:hypothetical protein
MNTLGDCLRQHIDRYCGVTPDACYREDRLNVGVARFDNVPEQELVTSITVGLSAHRLKQDSGREIRQELMFCVDRRYSELLWHEILFAVCKQVVDRGGALSRGEVIGPAGPLFPEASWCRMVAAVCTSPTMFDEAFGETTCGNDTLVVVELVPITGNEAGFVKRLGWSALFDRVNTGHLNIFDLTRS